jgi:hypothetical protein
MKHWECYVGQRVRIDNSEFYGTIIGIDNIARLEVKMDGSDIPMKWYPSSLVCLDEIPTPEQQVHRRQRTIRVLYGL